MSEEKLSVKKIGEFIKEARKAQKLSQEDLAAMSKTGRRVIGELENGKETIQLGKALVILSNLGIGINLIKDWEK